MKLCYSRQKLKKIRINLNFIMKKYEIHYIQHRTIANVAISRNLFFSLKSNL